MTTTDIAITDLASAYERGKQDATEAFTRAHLERIGDVLDAVDQHAGNPEQLRAAILTAMGHDAP